MPFKAHWRHEYWTVHVRYLDRQLGDGNIYGITILDNYSRFIVESVISQTQNLRAFLHVLLSAITEYGAPRVLVSDGGSIFRAKGAMTIYRTLSIRKEQIAQRQPWQSYIETCFNVQLRMADYHFRQAHTWDELLERHVAWVHDYNSQAHWAHLKRQDDRRNPAEVLDQVKGRAFSDQDLARIFAPLLMGRRVDRQGYVRFRNWRLYGERGLVGQPASVWITDEEVTIQSNDEPLATYTVAYQRDRRHFRQVTPKQIFETRHASPQPPLLEVGPDDWLLTIEQPRRRRRRRRRRRHGLIQASLFAPEEMAAGR